MALGDQAAKLVASDHAAGDVFGSSVALFGDRALVGAPANLVSVGTGRAVLFAKVAGSWVEVQQFRPSGSTLGDAFGHSVAIAEGVIVIGSPAAPSGGVGRGVVYVYEEVNGAFVEVARLFDATAENLDFFGGSGCGVCRWRPGGDSCWRA